MKQKMFFSQPAGSLGANACEGRGHMFGQSLHVFKILKISMKFFVMLLLGPELFVPSVHSSFFFGRISFSSVPFGVSCRFFVLVVNRSGCVVWPWHASQVSVNQVKIL